MTDHGHVAVHRHGDSKATIPILPVDRPEQEPMPHWVAAVGVTLGAALGILCCWLLIELLG